MLASAARALLAHCTPLHCTLLRLPRPPRLSRLLHSAMTVTAAQDPAQPSAAKMQRVEASTQQPAAADVEQLRVKRLNEHALLPKRGSAGAAGYDLAA